MPAAAAPTAAQDTPRGYRGWQSAGCAAHAAMPAATAKGQPTPILSAAANGRASAPALPDCGRKREELQRLGTEHQRLEQELRQNASEPPSQPAENWEAWWADASLEQRRHAAGLLLREVRLFPTYGEVYLQ